MLLAVKVASAFDRLTRPEKVNVLILVDSVIKRNRSKKVELLARVYDHVERFNLLSSASESNRYNEVSDSIDHRTNGYKFRKSSMMHKTDAAIQLIRNALTTGIKADYVLMDTWFTTEPMLKNILDTGIHAIGMVKQLQQRYTYNDRQYTLPGLKNSLIFPVPEISLVPLLSQPKPGLRLRLYNRMGGWIDGVYRQINKRYQKILFHIRSAYFANDLLTLTLQLLSDGICYGFLIYRLAHGTMTVSGFVLMLGAVSGFSSYFNEITSSLSKSVLCLEQIRWMREFLDLPLPAGLWEKIAGLPQKEETYLGKDMTDDGVTLSGGEMQKFMMARALYKNCRLLLLDEPTAALDAISENEMYETYSTLLKNKTALFISHRLASTRFCDTILFLENGRIKERGTHDELLALGGSYAHMFEVQSQYYQETEKHI